MAMQIRKDSLAPLMSLRARHQHASNHCNSFDSKTPLIKPLDAGAFVICNAVVVARFVAGA